MTVMVGDTLNLAQIEALPPGTVVIDHGGVAWQQITQFKWREIGHWDAWPPEGLLEQYSPVTLAWVPRDTS